MIFCKNVHCPVRSTCAAVWSSCSAGSCLLLLSETAQLLGKTPYILYLQTLFCLRFPGFSLSANIVSMVIYCTTLNIVDGDCLP